ncbi:MAG: DUF2804 domain-containing protein [Bacteroidetes bacterium]|nr:DUF2804 domain-containing protein [Bacteroidota bacterium]
MQHRITTPGKLLNTQGHLREPGWATQPMLHYNRAYITAARWRIKEWDYYAVISRHFGLACTVSDNGYLGLVSVTLFDFDKKTEHTKTILTPLPLGSYNLPATTSEGTVCFKHKQMEMEFKTTPGQRTLHCSVPDFLPGQHLKAAIVLQQPPMDTMVIATPFSEDPKAFYYNQKINCLRASGTVQSGSNTFRFDPDTDMATFDWGRGVWTYRNTWYWGSGNGWVQGKPFGFNIGYGFGNTTTATENMLFYDGKAHKLEHVTFHIPPDSFLQRWKFSSSDGRFEMDFVPILDRAALINAIVVSTDQHQVFGYLSGTAILDNGERLQIENLLCFAEKVSNKF